MIKPELKDIIITANPYIVGKLEVDEFIELGDEFLLSCTACIGTKESNGCDYFDFTIISPKALEKELRVTNLILGRAYFIVDHLDMSLLKQRIEDILSNCQGETWEDVALKLSPYFYWEYEK